MFLMSSNRILDDTWSSLPGSEFGEWGALGAGRLILFITKTTHIVMMQSFSFKMELKAKSSVILIVRAKENNNRLT